MATLTVQDRKWRVPSAIETEGEIYVDWISLPECDLGGITSAAFTNSRWQILKKLGLFGVGSEGWYFILVGVFWFYPERQSL